MKKIVCLFVCLFVGTANAGLITSNTDSSLSGATTDTFSSYAVGSVSSISDGFFTITQNGGGSLDVTDSFNGSYGAVGRSFVSFGYQGITIDFNSAVSAFGIHIGGSDYNWLLDAEAFGSNNVSLGSATVTHSTQGFYLGWSDANIGSVVLSPVSTDAVLFDNLSYVENTTEVPEPASIVLLGLGLAGIGFSRKKKST